MTSLQEALDKNKLLYNEISRLSSIIKNNNETIEYQKTSLLEYKDIIEKWKKYRDFFPKIDAMSEVEKETFLNGEVRSKMFTLKLPSWCEKSKQYEYKNYHFDSKILSDSLSTQEKINNILYMIIIPGGSISLQTIVEIFEEIGINIGPKQLDTLITLYIIKHRDRYPQFNSYKGIYYGITI